jgi:predicted PurR-regulated permease PerM
MISVFGEHTTRLLILGAIALALVFAFFTVSILLVPLVAAPFVVYLVDPAVIRRQRHNLSPGNSFLLILIAVLACLGLLLAFIPSRVSLESFSASDTDFAVRIERQMTEMETWIQTKVPMLESFEIAANVMARGAGIIVTFFNELPGLIASVAINLLLVPFIAYFIIRDGGAVKRRLVEPVPNRYFEMSLVVLHQIATQVGGYFRGRLIESILVGVALVVSMGVLSFWMTLPHILLMGIVIGITNLIPYVGPAMGLTFGAALYLGQGLTPGSILGLVIAVAIAQLLDNLVFAPVVLSQNVDLHPLAVVLVLVIGGEFLGVMGLLIAVPVAASVKIVVGEVCRSYRLQARAMAQ